MKTIEQHLDVDVPVSHAYAQWTQFEDMPRYFELVQEVEQLDESHLRWVVQIGSVTRTWHAEITEQVPEKRIAWKSEGSVPNAGCVTFHRLDDEHCRVMLQLDLEPEQPLDQVADVLKLTDIGVASELERFKDFVESHEAPTGHWSGRIEAPHERGPDA